MKIHNYNGNEFEVEIDKENTVAVVKIEISGDEILGVLHKDGSEEWHFADTCGVSCGYADRFNFIPKEEW